MTLSGMVWSEAAPARGILGAKSRPLNMLGQGSKGVIMVDRLKGKVALVTGSGRNIGRATILKLAEEGANVVVNARANREEAESTAREARELGVDALAILADVADRDQVNNMMAQAMDHFGQIDVLISNAAIRPHKPFMDLTLEDWERVRGVVLDGAFYCAHAVIPSMVKNHFGAPGIPGRRRCLGRNGGAFPRVGSQDGLGRLCAGAGVGVCAPQHPGQRDRAGKHQHFPRESPMVPGSTAHCFRNSDGASRGRQRNCVGHPVHGHRRWRIRDGANPSRQRRIGLLLIEGCGPTAEEDQTAKGGSEGEIIDLHADSLVRLGLPVNHQPDPFCRFRAKGLVAAPAAYDSRNSANQDILPTHAEDLVYRLIAAFLGTAHHAARHTHLRSE